MPAIAQFLMAMLLAVAWNVFIASVLLGIKARRFSTRNLLIAVTAATIMMGSIVGAVRLGL